jgi:nitroreductase
VFCARNDAAETVERFIKSCDIDAKAPPYAQAVRGSISSMPSEQFQAWSTNQAYIALGVACTAAADARIGACPMSGFVPKDVHRVLELPPNQWPVAYLAIGSHVDNKEDPNRVKFRLPWEELFAFPNSK